MTDPCPPAGLAAMQAAIDDYRLITPPTDATAAGLAEWIATYLASTGYAIRPQAPQLDDLTDAELEAWVASDPGDATESATRPPRRPDRCDAGVESHTCSTGRHAGVQRFRLDDMTDDQLDGLCADLERAETDAARYRLAWQSARDRAVVCGIAHSSAWRSARDLARQVERHKVAARAGTHQHAEEASP